MIKNRTLLFRVFIIGITLIGMPLSPLNSLDFLNFSKPTKRTGFLLTPIESKQKQLEEVESAYNHLKKDSYDANSSITRRINEIQAQIAEIESAMRYAGEDQEYLNKKINLLNERKQNLLSVKEIWVEAEEIAQKHIKLLNEIIESLKNKKSSDDRNIFYLKDLKEIYAKIAEVSNSIRLENSKKESLAKQKKTEEEDLLALTKKIEENKEDQKKVLEKALGTTDEDNKTKLKEKVEISEISSGWYSDQKERSEAIIKKLDFDIKYTDDLIKWLESVFSTLKKKLNLIQTHLYLTPKDAEASKDELDKEAAKAIAEKNNLSKQREIKKTEKRRWKTEFLQLDSRNKQLVEQGKQKTADGYLIKSKFERADNLIKALDKEIEFLYASRELEDAKLTLKKLQTKLVHIIYHLQADTYEKNDLNKWINEYTKAKSKEENEIKSLDEKRTEISNFSAELKIKTDEVKNQIDLIKNKKDEIFKDNPRLFIDTLAAFSDGLRFLERQINASQDIFLKNSELIRYKREIINQYDLILKAIEAKRQFDIWTPSRKAIKPQEILSSLIEGSELTKDMIWQLPNYANPLNLIKAFYKSSYWSYLGLFIFLMLILILYFLMKLTLNLLIRATSSVKEYIRNSYGLFTVELIESILIALKQNFKVFYLWLFVLLDINYNFKSILGNLGNFTWYNDSRYLASYFYLLTVPLLIIACDWFIKKLSDLNWKYNFILFRRDLANQKFKILGVILYSSCILLPLRHTALILNNEEKSKLVTVIFAIYTIICEIAAASFVFLYKDDFLKLLKTNNWIVLRIRNLVEKNFQIIFVFLCGLLILSNPYVGYSNLAYLVLYAAPLSLLICYGLFAIHTYIRKYSAYWFISEEDEEVVDLFDHAKTYFGIFVILSFLFLLFVAFLLMAFIWGVNSPIDMIQYLLQEKWTIEMADGKRIGILDFVLITLFMAGGFLVSTLIDKFLLTKLFDILRMDLGVRNTVSSILHYIIIYIVIVFGLTTISLGGYVFWISSVLFAGIAFASQDFLKDFIAGFLILLERPIEIGNFIELEHTLNGAPTRGTVYKISPRSTSIRTVNNHLIIVPNRDVLNNPISNWGYGRSTVGFELNLNINYGNDPAFIFKLLNEVLSNDSRIMRIPAPTFRLEDFGEAGMRFFIRSFISARRVREQWDIASDLRISITHIFKKNGIKISVPQRIIHSSNEYENNFKDQNSISVKFDKQ